MEQKFAIFLYYFRRTVAEMNNGQYYCLTITTLLDIQTDTISTDEHRVWISFGMVTDQILLLLWADLRGDFITIPVYCWDSVCGIEFLIPRELY